MNERKALLASKYALIKIHTILELADGHTSDNGLELNENEWQAIYEAIQNGLDGENV
jgi:hypothetical protein